MGIFRSILNKIFPSNHPAVTSPTAATPTTTAQAPAVAPPASSGANQQAAGAAAAAAAALPPVDVEAILTEMAAKSGQPSNWRTSIVDLMKLLDLDSSLAARKELAAELGYTRDTSDSAAMNIWLHKQVMAKLAENGGKVPDSLKD